MKERLTAWSSKVAEYEHQLKAIDGAQKTFLVREMMPKDIKRESLTGPRKFEEIMEKLEIIINEMMADDGPVPLDLGNVGTHDAKATRCGIVEEELMHGRVAEVMTGARKANRTGSVTRTKKGGTGDKGKGKGESETRDWFDCGEQWRIAVNCSKKADQQHEEEDQGSSWERRRKRQRNSRAWTHLLTSESGSGWEGTGSPEGEGGLIQDQHFHYLAGGDEDEQVSGGLNHLVP